MSMVIQKNNNSKISVMCPLNKQHALNETANNTSKLSAVPEPKCNLITNNIKNIIISNSSDKTSIASNSMTTNSDKRKNLQTGLSRHSWHLTSTALLYENEPPTPVPQSTNTVTIVIPSSRSNDTIVNSTHTSTILFVESLPASNGGMGDKDITTVSENDNGNDSSSYQKIIHQQCGSVNNSTATSVCNSITM